MVFNKNCSNDFLFIDGKVNLYFYFIKNIIIILIYYKYLKNYYYYRFSDLWTQNVWSYAD